ncbi:MAG: threonine/serine exporter family protein [Lachnospiraceae bacterium]|nr:threonine/serine exporter family protein [Lachnospiraceae bacterium]
MSEIIQLAAAVLGTLGFAVLFNIRGKKLLFAALGGLLVWGVYLIAAHITANEYLCGFLASVMLTVYAECMARVHRTPVTVFLVSAAIPLIPGGALYRAMDCLLRRDWEGAADSGSYALLFAASMSAGITLTTVVIRSAWKHFRKERRM